MKRKSTSGQTLLIILLVMAVALTIGLSVVSRSITDIRVSEQEEESARVFSAAEAGIEQAILSGGGDYTMGDITVQVTETAQGGGAAFVFPKEIRGGDTQTVWLVDHLDEDTLGSDFYAGTDLIFYWGDETIVGEIPAFEAVILYDIAGSYRTRRVAFDPQAGVRPESQGFTSVSAGSYSLGGKTFSFKANFTDDQNVIAEGLGFPSGNLYAVRIKLLFNDQAQILGVEAVGDDLPLQGTCYESAAERSDAGISRKVEQCQFYKAPPDIFDYVLFSESNLTHL